MKDNFWKGKNIFITGINGFIGSNLAKLLISLGANVFGLIRNPDNRTLLYFEEIDKKVLSIKDFKRKRGKVSHQFSHFNLLLTVYEKKEFNVNDINGMWVDKKDLSNLGLPTLMKKVFNHINT